MADNKHNIKAEKASGKIKVSFFSSIRFRLIAAFFVPIACVAVLGIISYNKASSAIKTQYVDQSLQTTDVLKEYVLLIIEGEKEEFKTYLADKDLTLYFKGALDKSASILVKKNFGETFSKKLIAHEKIKDIYFIGDEGRFISARKITMADNAYQIFSESEEGQAMLTDTAGWHLFGRNDELDEALGLNVGEYSLRYVRKFGNHNAAMIIDFNAGTVRNVLSMCDAGQGGYVALVTTDGVEFSSDEAYSGLNMVYGQSYYDKAIASAEPSGSDLIEYAGKTYLFTYSKIDEAGNMVATLIPYDNISAKTADIKTLTMILAIVAIVVSLILAIIISAGMLRTIKYMQRKLDKVADGDLTTELHAKGRDELATLGGSINHMIGNVKGLITKVNDISLEVETSAHHMSEASGTFKSTSDNISESAVRIEDGTEKLDANSGNALSEMDSLSAVIGEVTSNTEEISRLTVETENTINDGIESVEGLTKSAGATADITAEVIASIKDLEEKLKSVHTVVKAINDIAGKTNLLSLNASIEAARAGEAGRGFTVVAEEIRNLSTQCMESAGKISEIVNEVSARTEDVVNTALRAEETVGSQTGAVEKTRDSFETIREQVSSLLSSLETIIENAKRMEDSRVSTLSSIEGISSISGETVSCAADVKGAAEKQKESIENLDRASEQLYSKSEELIKALEKFTV